MPLLVACQLADTPCLHVSSRDWGLRPESLCCVLDQDASSPLLSPVLGIKIHFSEVDSVHRAHRATWPIFLTLAVLLSTLSKDWSQAEWASHSHSASTQLEFWRGTFIGYVCNPSSLRGRDAGSRGHTSGIPASACFIPRSWRRFHRTCFYASWSLYHPARDVSPIHWSDYTRDSERGHSGGVPIALRCSISLSQGTRVTYVT